MLSCSVQLFCDPYGLEPIRLLCVWDLPGENTEVDLPFPPPGDLPDPGIEPASPVAPALQVDSLPLRYREALIHVYMHVFYI